VHGFTDMVLRLIDHVGYAGLFVAMALGNIGAPVGSEVILPAAGALVATGHLKNLWVTIAIAVVAELVGQSAAYAIGRFGGRPLVARYGHYVRFHEAELARVDAFFARFGSFAIFICRFIPVIRGVVGIPAGIARMALGPFYLWTLLGSALFCGGLILIGNALGAHVDALTPVFHKYGLAAAALAILAIVVFLILQKRGAPTAPTP
jgi:membrane protein DedA with SNARE-associated domain